MSVYKKLAAVMKDVKYVQKTGYNSFHKYSYAKESDYIESLRPALLKHGLIVVPSTMNVLRDEKNAELTTVTMNFDIVDVDTGEKITVPAAGQGSDKADKGVYKAITGAKKYFLGLAFLIETGDDAEADETTDAPAETPASKRSAIKVLPSAETAPATTAAAEPAATTAMVESKTEEAPKKSFTFRKPGQTAAPAPKAVNEGMDF